MDRISGASPSIPGLGGIVLAAGASERMGSPKALLRVPPSRALAGATAAAGSGRGEADEGRCLLMDQAARLLRAGCARIVTVVGADAVEIEARLRESLAALSPRVILRSNPDWSRGVFSSLQVGLRALPPCAAGVIVLPVDVPGVAIATFARILAGAGIAGAGVAGAGISAAGPARTRAECDAVVPVRGGRGGHPVWLSASGVARVEAEAPDARLDHLLRALRTLRVEVDDPRAGGNINSPEDWRAFCGDAS